MQQLQQAYEQRYPGLVAFHLVDMMATDDEETRQAFYLIKSRAIIPPLVTVNRRLCQYGELDADCLQQAISQELERRFMASQNR